MPEPSRSKTPKKKRPANRALAAGALVLVALAGLGAALLWPRAEQGGREAAQSAPEQAAVFGGALSPFQFAPRPFPAPDLQFTEATGAPATLSEFAGDVVLLNFWATWCAPCLGELPALDRLQASLADEPFTVLALNQDREAELEVIESYYRRLEIENLGLYLDPGGAAAKALNVTGLPTTVLVDRDGRVVGGLTGPAEWDTPEAEDLIQRILAGPTAAESSEDSLPSSETRP